jgi:hypothetical protein
VACSGERAGRSPFPCRPRKKEIRERRTQVKVILFRRSQSGPSIWKADDVGVAPYRSHDKSDAFLPSRAVVGVVTNEEMPYDGFGIAIGLVVGAIVCLWAPNYLDATSGWQTFWLVVGGILGLLGLGGALLELAKLRGQRGLDDWGAALVLVGLAAIAGVLENQGIISGLLATSAKYFVIGCLFWAAVGGGRGFARVTLAKAPKATRRRGDSKPVVLGTLTAAAGLATAIVNFVRAVQG